MAFLQGKSLRRRAEPAVASQQGPLRPDGLKRSADQIETPVQRYGVQISRLGSMPLSHSNAHVLLRKKRARRTISTGQASRPGPEAEANTRRAPDTPPIEEADRLSATNSEVESAMNHRRRRTVLRDACFSQEALDAFNSGDAYLRAAQNGLARATEQYVKDIRVRKFGDYIYQ